MAKDKKVSVARIIDAPTALIFEVLATPERHAEIDGSGTVLASHPNSPDRLSLGARFGMKMRFGVPYDIRNEVVEFDEGKLIAWQHFGHHRWRFELEEIDQGTMVTETFDWSTSRLPLAIELAGYPKRHAPNMRATLDRLAELVGAPV